jgi:hypothetical protein
MIFDSSETFEEPSLVVSEVTGGTGRHDVDVALVNRLCNCV